MSFFTFVCCIAVLNIGVGFFFGLRCREVGLEDTNVDLHERDSDRASDWPRDVLASSAESMLPSVEESENSADAAEIAADDTSSERSASGTANGATDIDQGKRTAAAWRESPKLLLEELQRIERNLPILRGCTDARTIRRVIDELTRVLRRQLSEWTAAWESLTQKSGPATKEQELLEQAISQAESTLANLAQLAVAETAESVIADIEKELIKLKRFESLVTSLV